MSNDFRQILKNISEQKRHLEGTAHTRDTALVSVCIPNYNKGRFLTDAVRSIVDQKVDGHNRFTNWEVIVVDDHSTDDSLTRLEQYMWSEEISREDSKRILIHRLPRRCGTSWAQNVAYYLSRGEFIANLDSDDVSLPTRLYDQVIFLRYDKYDLAGTNLDIFNGHPDNIIQSGTKWLLFDDKEILNSYQRGTHCVCFGTVMFNRKVLEKTGGMNKDLIGTEDFEFIDRAIKSGFRVGNLNKTLYLYRDSTNQRSKLFHGK